MQRTCDICKKNIFLIKHRLVDGTILCNNCANKIPIDILDYVTLYWNKNNLEDYLEYKKYSDEQLAPIFKETYRIGSISLDEDNALYKLSSSLIVYEVKNIQQITFTFDPERVQKSILFRSYAIGTSKAHITSIMPVFKLSTILSTRARANGYMENHVFNTRLPDHAIELQARVRQMIVDLEKRQKQQKESATEQGEESKQSEFHNNDYKRGTNSADPIPEAIRNSLALFMMDSLVGVTVIDLKKQRNKLLKAFHPDEGESGPQYAKKINSAYETLKECIERKQGL